jgi:hypothetical protein
LAEPQPEPTVQDDEQTLPETTVTETHTEAAEIHAGALNKGAIVKKSQKRSTKRAAKELIEKEWEIVDKLQELADKKENERQQTFYYQTLASHVRTLSMLLKLHGQQDQSQDLAKLLSEIDDKATQLAKRLKQK